MTDELRAKRVAAYARFSSAMQRESSIEDQLRRCREYVEAHGGSWNVELVFADAAVSGASLHREGFERLMAMVRAKPRQVDVIVTEDMSRISRDLADSALLFKQLKYFDVPLIGVADGIDSAAKGAKVAFTIKSLLSDMYLDELADKTRRGLEGRALKGYSTGGLPIGYRSVSEHDADGRVVGHRIEIDEQAAATVRRIYGMYRDGMSYDSIARQLNVEHVPPPRAKTKHRRKGWVASTIRDIVHNEAYVGHWSFGKRRWVKVPGTNARRPQMRPESEVIRHEFVERRIIDEDLWQAVKERREAVHAKYTRNASTQTAPGRRTNYPLSGLLRCGCCGAPMVIAHGTSASYYRCGDFKKRGTCANGMSVREDVARRAIFGAMIERLRRPAAIKYLAKRIAERLGELNRTLNRELGDRRERLARAEARLGKLVAFIADGNDSAYVKNAIADFEAQAKSERDAIAALEAHAAAPIALPTAGTVVERALDLERVLIGEPLRAREALRRYFRGGSISLEPQHDAGHYIAQAEFLPLVALAEMTKPPAKCSGARVPSVGCAGRI